MVTTQCRASSYVAGNYASASAVIAKIPKDVVVNMVRLRLVREKRTAQIPVRTPTPFVKVAGPDFTPLTTSVLGPSTDISVVIPTLVEAYEPAWAEVRRTLSQDALPLYSALDV